MAVYDFSSRPLLNFDTNDSDMIIYTKLGNVQIIGNEKPLYISKCNIDNETNKISATILLNEDITTLKIKVSNNKQELMLYQKKDGNHIYIKENNNYVADIQPDHIDKDTRKIIAVVAENPKKIKNVNDTGKSNYKNLIVKLAPVFKNVIEIDYFDGIDETDGSIETDGHRPRWTAEQSKTNYNTVDRKVIHESKELTFDLSFYYA